MKRFLVTLVVLPLLLLVSACGSSDDASHNDADIAFAQQMVPHHEQAVAMSELVPSAGGSADVAALARQIRSAQAPEISRMTSWLDDWDATGHAGGMDHMEMGDGMASDSDLEKLATSKGADFDRLWLTLMTAHHTGAIEMARTELSDGQDPRAKKLAQDIIDTQQQEIDTMKGLQR